MARFILLFVLAIVIARTFWRFIDAIARGARGPFDSAQGNSAQPGGRRAGGPPSAVKMQQCPVCGTYVVPGKAITMVSNGAPIYFDSERCRAEYQGR